MIRAGFRYGDDAPMAIIEFVDRDFEAKKVDIIKKKPETADKEKTIEAQNYYCHNQQQNPHTPRVMKSLGLKEEDVELFCTDALFPKIK